MKRTLKYSSRRLKSKFLSHSFHELNNFVALALDLICMDYKLAWAAIILLH